MPQRWKVPISIVAVNRIDHTDWLNIMVDYLNHLSPNVLISYVIQFFDFPMYGNEQMVIFTVHLHTSVAQFGSILSCICILASSMPIRQQRWIIINFTMLKEREHFFIWHLYAELPTQASCNQKDSLHQSGRFF